MKVILVDTQGGTAGDVRPLIAIGREMNARGHDACVLTSEVHEKTVRHAELGFRSIIPADEFRKTVDHPDYLHPKRYMKHAFQTQLIPFFEQTYNAIVDEVEGFEDRALLVGTAGAYPANLAHEKLGIPFATLWLQPSALLSSFDFPVIQGLPVPRWSPRFVKRLVRYASIRYLDSLVLEFANDFRDQIGLGRVKSFARECAFSPQLNIALFAEWFGAAQPDWPANSHVAGFPFYDRGTEPLASPILQQWLTEDRAPIVFYPSTKREYIEGFVKSGIGACEQLGRKGVIACSANEPVFDDLPPFMLRLGYIPFGQLLPRVAAIVHNGGVGTVAQGCAAAIPQVIVPSTNDQPDNADRVRRLGVGHSLPHGKLSASRLAKALSALLDSDRVLSRCQEIAQRIEDSAAAVQKTADLLEAHAVGRPRASPAN